MSLTWNNQDTSVTRTAAGTGQIGSEDGAARQSTFHEPVAVAIVPGTAVAYVADRQNHAVREMALDEGGFGLGTMVTTVAGGVRGYRDGFGTDARLNEPSGLAIDGTTRKLYIADSANAVIRVLDLVTRYVSTLCGSPNVVGFVDGPASAALFSRPLGLALHLRARQLFVADSTNHAVRVVHVDTLAVRTLAGTGTAAGEREGRGEEVALLTPQGVTVDEEARVVYIADLTPLIKRADMAREPAFPSVAGASAYSSRVVVSVDGSGGALQKAAGVAHAFMWNSLLVSDYQTHRILRLQLPYQASPPPPNTQLSLFPGLPARLPRPPPPTTTPMAPVPSTPTASQPTPKAPVPSSSPPPPPGEIEACAQGVDSSLAQAAGTVCHGTLLWLAGNVAGHHDGVGINTQYHRPYGLAATYRASSGSTRAYARLYVADSVNQRVRVIELTDIVAAVVDELDPWLIVIAKVAYSNLMLILIVIGGLCVTGCFLYLVCRYCFMCPLYRKRWHARRLDSMMYGTRV